MFAALIAPRSRPTASRPALRLELRPLCVDGRGERYPVYLAVGVRPEQLTVDVDEQSASVSWTLSQRIG
jgi:hypothetical protein